MALDLFNEFAVLGDCDQCGRLFMFDGKNARARYTTAKAKFGIDLCQMCVAARQAGRFEFACQRLQFDGNRLPRGSETTAQLLRKGLLP